MKRRNQARKIAERIKSRVRCNNSSLYTSKSNGFSSKKALLQNYANFKCSDTPCRFMFCHNKFWVGLSGEEFRVLKSGFLAGRSMELVSIEGTEFLFDFLTMLIIEMVTAMQSKVDVNGEKHVVLCRAILGHAEKIEGGSPQFHPSSIDFDSGVDNVENPNWYIVWSTNMNKHIIPLLIVSYRSTDQDRRKPDTHSLSYTRMEGSSQDNLGSKIRTRNATTLNLMKTRNQARKITERIKSGLHRNNSSLYTPNSNGFSSKKALLRNYANFKRSDTPCRSMFYHNGSSFGLSGEEFEVLKSNFLAGRSMELVSIEGTEFLFDFLRMLIVEMVTYGEQRNQREMTKAARGIDNTRLAWHGTSSKGVSSIITYGFGMHSKFPVAESYGVGIYLSSRDLPHTSEMQLEVDVNGEKHVVLCRVILGHTEKIEGGSQQFHPSSIDFDSGVDNVENPNWYIVWSTNMNMHIIPLLIVSYRSTDQGREEQECPVSSSAHARDSRG
ncbi:hypothetical protein HHK36_004436 [Tetracentron sinense]|uniref:Poly [ADP-ribose] polymerase n=1 Tax=Tetracentron sinense TaxID=13715 RepID=A0A835A0F5_TETSI|nr:hypothetical protein HHK36_004436 [Tetracentron sinense]